MIELPEAMAIGAQLNQTKGEKRMGASFVTCTLFLDVSVESAYDPSTLSRFMDAIFTR